MRIPVALVAGLVFSTTTLAHAADSAEPADKGRRWCDTAERVNSFETPA